MSDVEVKIKPLNTSRHRWYSRSSIIKAFSCQPSSLLPKLGLLFHILAKNIQLNHQSNLPDTLNSKRRKKVVSGCVTVCFGLFPVTPTFHTSLFRSDPAREHLINRLKCTSDTALVNKSINIFNDTYLGHSASSLAERTRTTSKYFCNPHHICILSVLLFKFR